MNRYRLKKIVKFGELYNNYMDGISYSQHTGITPIESDNSTQARKEINKILKIVRSIIENAEISTTGNFTPPFATYEYQNVDIVLNIFSDDIIRNFSAYVRDTIDQTIGVYENNFRNSFFNMINPFYWIGRIVNLLIKIVLEPFGIKIPSKVENIVSLLANLATIVSFILLFSDKI